MRDDDGVYSYASKYLSGGGGMESSARELPAALPEGIRNRVLSYSSQLARVFNLTGAPRVDFLWDGGDGLALCEVNAIPGAWGAYLWQEVGVDRPTLLRSLVAEAQSMPTRRPQWAATSDGAALRVAGSMAAKLA